MRHLTPSGGQLLHLLDQLKCLLKAHVTNYKSCQMCSSVSHNFTSQLVRITARETFASVKFDADLFDA